MTKEDENAIKKMEREIASLDRDIDDLQSDLDEAETKRARLAAQLQSKKDGITEEVIAEVKERCAVLLPLHLTGSERESVEDLLANETPESSDLRRLKEIELNHLMETAFA